MEITARNDSVKNYHNAKDSPLKVSCILIILTEAVVQRCSVKEGFFEISQN